MVGPVPPAARSDAAAITTVPLPRRPPNPDDPARPAGPTRSAGSAGQDDRDDRVRGWYENELGWATVPGSPVRLSVGERFDVLDVPAEAGFAGLRRLAPGSPVAVGGGRMLLLVAAGGAEEVPGILQWLEWGALALDLTAIGAGGSVEAPLPPARLPGRDPVRPPEPCRPGPVQGAAVWLRPPVAGCEVAASLPTMSASGGVGGAPDLVRLVDTLATHCHRVRLRRASAQPLAFS
ncbi:SCO3374 family protein [Streptomyces sp. NPDC058291]|uniref:SCO3374 family protein n=1 Tax=Streptomyces sp. NPDC058291 TaxID=3346427 RepID=UPI0036EF23F4